jgi:hypothetical protein
MSWQRWCGWGVVAAVLLSCALTTWWSGPTASDVQLSEEQRSALRSLPEEARAEWLAIFEDSLQVAAPSAQVMLVLAVPKEAPLVIGLPSEADGNEPSTHWRTPWEGVQEALQGMPAAQPLLARSRHAGFDYVHHLFPIDDDGERWLLVNEMAPVPRWTGWRGLASCLATLLSIALLIRS